MGSLGRVLTRVKREGQIAYKPVSMGAFGVDCNQRGGQSCRSGLEA